MELIIRIANLKGWPGTWRFGPLTPFQGLYVRNVLGAIISLIVLVHTGFATALIGPPLGNGGIDLPN